MFIIKYKKIFFIISAVLVAGAIFSMFSFGLKFGIDFKGGSILEVVYPEDGVEHNRPDITAVNQKIKELSLGSVLVQPAGEDGFIVRSKELSEAERMSLLNALSLDGSVVMQEKKFNSVGPTMGAELRSKAWVAIATVIIAIILFIAFVFRRVSESGVSSWKYGVIAIIALAHDIIIPAGIFSALGYEFDSLFVIALLAILGLSVNDTIVVFDRVRENIKNKISKDFSETVGMSLKQTFTRSINTSLTTLFVLLTLYFVGPESTQHFALALALGIFFGTYSSIFLASPLLVAVEKFGKTNGKRK
jgi:preprotein translocase subunit SecF